MSKGITIFFSSNTDNNFRVACYDSLKCSNTHSIEMDTDINVSDWSYAIGEAFGGFVIEVCNSGNQYSATINYCLMDYYEWGYHAAGNDYILHHLHECGLAREFPVYGQITISFSWIEGERIACASQIIKMLE